jgi:hypothetical protein
MRIEATDLTPLEQRLVDEAVKIRPRAYAVYSNYLVGAAVADADGGIHVGANMEGADYTLTVHAEQHAMNAMRLATNAKAVALAFAVQSPSDSHGCGGAGATNRQQGERGDAVLQDGAVGAGGGDGRLVRIKIKDRKSVV